MIKIAVFASGGGTNLQALIDACNSRRIQGRIVLVASNRSDAGALQRAQRAGIPALAVRSRDYSTPEAYDACLAAECRKAQADLVCLAGYMRLLTEPMLQAFPNRILNIHPALLPSFGGKGMYGRNVHEAVLGAGAKVSGCTVHLVDPAYDHGPILGQSSVPVLADDTPDSLAARVLTQEHWLYPEVVRLFADGRVKTDNGRIRILPSREEGSSRIRRALLSVSDKRGLVEFAKRLEGMGVEIVSTSGTARVLREAGVEVRSLSSLTGFPEILGGRVKTLHPKVHGGILLRRSDPAQALEASTHGLEPIDLVAVNLYPFAETAAKASSPFSREVLEDIDIGGVTLIRAAAKNFEDVAVVVSPDDYTELLDKLEKASGRIDLETRRRLALRAFQHTAEYDAMISGAWREAEARGEERASFPDRMSVSLDRVQTLRYGENPHQAAALYVRSERGAPSYEQLHGKELSYNNLLDAFGTWDCVSEFDAPAAVVFKHVTPSGVGCGEGLQEAFERAWASDPVSAFGGILAVNRPFPASIARDLKKRFLEVIVAPSFEPEALELLKKKPKLRLLVMKSPPPRSLMLRSLGDEVLVTEPDRTLFSGELQTKTRRAPTPAELKALRFAWAVCKHVRSNAIVLSGPEGTVGVGAGQMSRVDAVRLAGEKFALYRKENPAPEPLVLASDAFFPFRDGLDAAAELGVKAVIQPGGSVRDQEVVEAADRHDMAMVFTGLRHFRH